MKSTRKVTLNNVAAIAGIVALIFAVLQYIQGCGPDMETVDWNYKINMQNTAEYTCTWNGNEIGRKFDCKGTGTCGSKTKGIEHCKAEYAPEVKRILLGNKS